MKISVIYADNLMQLRCVDEKEIFIVSPSTIGNSFLLHMLGNMVVGDTNAIAVVDGGLFKEYVTIRHRTHPGEPMVVTVRFNGAILHNLTTEEVAKHYPYVRESKVPPDSAVPVPGIRGYPDPYLRNKDFEGYGSVVQDYLETTHTALSLSDIFEEIADRIAMVQTAVKRGVYPDAPTPEEGNLIHLVGLRSHPWLQGQETHLCLQGLSVSTPMGHIHLLLSSPIHQWGTGLRCGR